MGSPLHVKLKSMRSMLTMKDFNMIINRVGAGSQTGMWAQRQMERLTTRAQ